MSNEPKCPFAHGAKTTLHVTKDMTVQQAAESLAKMASDGVVQVSISGP